MALNGVSVYGCVCVCEWLNEGQGEHSLPVFSSPYSPSCVLSQPSRWSISVRDTVAMVIVIILDDKIYGLGQLSFRLRFDRLLALTAAGSRSCPLQ